MIHKGRISYKKCDFATGPLGTGYSRDVKETERMLIHCQKVNLKYKYKYLCAICLAITE